VKAIAETKAAGFTVVPGAQGQGQANGQCQRPGEAVAHDQPMVRSMFGEFGIGMYGVWSPASHSGPFHVHDNIKEVSRKDGIVEVRSATAQCYGESRLNN
jgi:hypothetical protein